MTIGEKIAVFRSERGLSQEQLAELTEVSRQSVSKWEMGRALPQLDKLAKLCEIFGVSADEFISDKPSGSRGSRASCKNKYFGTDGFRGEAN
ncbi:MAG: helix-turn-helix domain-containing protein, partial [Clostridia bacterium]|nr:helix-turn-helix domain-containing protein [Clostridia bacterium]